MAMDLAYDHIQDTAFGHEDDAKSAPQSSLNSDLQEAYRAISSSAWGSKLGGFWGTVVKQGENVYREAQHELSAVSEEATKGLSGLRESIISRTRSLSMTLATDAAPREPADDDDKDGQTTPTRPTAAAEPQAPGSVLSILRTEAARRLRDIQHAEDAADEALVKFGVNLRDFLRDAIRIAPPESDDAGAVLFESKDARGTRVIHASRYEAQLHLIHASVESFAADPSTGEYAAWAAGLDLDDKTADISADLVAYPELRVTMEKLVPAQVSYADFWKRYYFLRQGIETAEVRRRDMLKAVSTEVEVGWGDESDDESESKARAHATDATTTHSTASSTTIDALPSSSPAGPPLGPPVGPPAGTAKEKLAVAVMPASEISKPEPSPPAAEPRKSNDGKSVADSEASYDLVSAASGNPSHAPDSPKDCKAGENSDDGDDDWE